MRYGPAKMEEIVARRDAEASTLLRFLYLLTPAVTGSLFWKKNILTTPYSDFVTVSDEVFIYFTVENNLDRWNFLLSKIVSAWLCLRGCFSNLMC